MGLLLPMSLLLLLISRLLPHINLLLLPISLLHPPIRLPPLLISLSQLPTKRSQPHTNLLLIILFLSRTSQLPMFLHPPHTSLSKHRYTLPPLSQLRSIPSILYHQQV